MNLHRRHDTENERALVGAMLANLQKGDNQHSTIVLSSPPVTQKEAAAMLNVGVGSIKSATVSHLGINDGWKAQDSPEVLAMWEKEMQIGQGHRSDLVDIVNEVKTSKGNSKAYTVSRLKR